MKKHKYIDFNDIIISDNFKSSSPKPGKYKIHEDYYNVFNKLKKPILVDENNILIDGYCSYLVLKKYNFSGMIDVIYYSDDSCYKNITTKYIFGVHPGQIKEFCWRLPNEYIDKNVEVGQEITVSTKYGKYKAIVTRVETLDKCPVDMNVRRVLNVESL